MMNKNVLAGMISSARDDWETPQDLFDQLDEEFDFTLDPCATKKNAKCKKYYTEKDDGLSRSWAGERVFVNPPYGRRIYKWVEKCNYAVFIENAKLVVALLPARTDTQWFHSYIYNGNTQIRFLKGRLKFTLNGVSKGPALFPSMVVVWRPYKW
jgi:site-specific DNA-methyltransferase (adenine-specific)